MAKIGHEAPLHDHQNQADLSSHPDEEQLGLGELVPPDAGKKEPEVPPGLKLTPTEESRIEKLQETMGLDRGTALQQTVSRSQANRIIGHHHSSGQVAKIERQMKERAAREAAAASNNDETRQLLKDTDPHK